MFMARRLSDLHIAALVGGDYIGVEDEARLTMAHPAPSSPSASSISIRPASRAT